MSHVGERYVNSNGPSSIIELASEILSKLDVFVSMAHTASTALGGMYTRPKMTKLGARGNIKLERARHPCLECQDDVNFIPNDYELNRDDSRLLVVTGPNMGGKSTYIRQLGIVLVLAQIGSFVPADDAELCIVDACSVPTRHAVPATPAEHCVPQTA